MTFRELRNDIIATGDVDLLFEFKDGFIQEQYFRFMQMSKYSTPPQSDLDELEDMIMICLDYYTYASSGDTLITDHEYDELMNLYRGFGKDPLVYADFIYGESTWPFVPHENPGMVGSVSKVYEEEDVELFMKKNSNPQHDQKYIIAPKYDGISSVIHSCFGKLVFAVTRNDGAKGQDITEVIRHSKNIKEILRRYEKQDVWIKTELCVGQTEFDELVNFKVYKNRRSATAGIVNSPKNIDLARFITIIPLAVQDVESGRLYYDPQGFKVISPDDYIGVMMGEIHKMLLKIRSADFEFRTDGVVIYPYDEEMYPNKDDVMACAIAYKVNTEFAYTQIDFGYVSLGRMGYGVPMLRVKPVEVNETTVTDVSLGSFDKFATMGLYENEIIEVYSAGNVIPQARVPEHREIPTHSGPLKIKKRCPYCHEKLRRYGGEYKCINDKCSRLITGRIANFLIKLKVKNISDATIEALYDAKLIHSIPDLFNLKAEDIAKLDGFGETKAENIIISMNKLKVQDTPISLFMGALGIQDISEKKCREIFKVISIEEMLNKSKGKLFWRVMDADKVAEATAKNFSTFIEDHRDEINELIGVMNIRRDLSWKGNVIFTGFRNDELEEKFNSIGYELGSGVNKSTVCVIDSSYGHESGKAKEAIRKNVDLIHISEADKYISYLKKKN